MREINEESYLRHLADGGFRLDFVTPSKVYCLEGAASCVVRPFSHGYFEYHGIEYSLRLITDLTLFRHLPMYLKERVYSDGSWLFADTVLDEASRFPEPVIREWVAHMSISDETPRYKWYHFNGTHAPARWTADCEFVEGLERSRENYKGQTLCVLRGIGRFLRRLKELNVYDQTAIVISGDHGCNVPADDLTGEVVVLEYYAQVLGADSSYCGVLSHNPMSKAHGPGFVTNWLHEDAYTLPELGEVIPMGWRRPAVCKTAIGRNCDLFRALMRWAGSPENIVNDCLAAAHAANQSFLIPLPDAEVAGIARSVQQYRLKWITKGKHYTPTQRTLWGRARGIKSGAARRKGTPLEDDQTPWLSMGISRAWWYRRYRHAQE